jgi:PKD repeat protein
MTAHADAPVVLPINFTPGSPFEGGTTTFGVVATDPEGETITYLWDFGEGSSSTDISPDHVFASDGSFIVTVTVTDFGGEFTSVDTPVDVLNANPTIQTLVGDLTGETGAVLSYQAVATDPGGDVLSYTWDWGDGSPLETGTTLANHTHSFASAGNYTVELEVSDGDGGTDEATLQVAVNALPVIQSMTADVASAVEGDVVTFEVVATDADQHALTYNWDFGDGSAPSGGDNPIHIFSDDGSYTVVVTVTDQVGGVGTQSLLFAVVNDSPELIALVGASTGVMGQSLGFAATVIDPGGVEETLTWTWDWGDGTTPTVGVDLPTASHIWSAAGSFTMVLSVEDEDGGVFSQPFTVLISNPGPTVSAISGPASVDEGGSDQWAVVASDASGNPVTLSWNWGDGASDDTGLDLLSVTHSYDDDGVYTITVTGSDGFGGTVTTSSVVTVVNLAPTFTTIPQGTALESTPYVVVLTSTDEGADSPSYTLNQSPTGTLFHALPSSLVWHPTLAQVLAGPASFEVQVNDGDGGTDTLTWTVVAAWIDVDLDGMADSWELLHGLDPTVDDSLGDADADGVSNLQEWLDQTDPNVSDGPGKPVPLSPVGGASATDEAPELIVSNAVDPNGDPLTYEFEIYEDPALSVLLYSGTEVEDSDGATEHTTSAGLPENAVLYWRARAHDGASTGAWSKVSPFFRDAVNDAPATPQPLFPVMTTVPGSLPTLLVAAVSDPEGDDLELTVRLYGEVVGLVATVLGSVSGEGDGSWAFVLPTPLEEDVRYEWSATATDARGAISLPSALVWFEVDAQNSPPEPPELLAPGDESDTQTPVIEASSAGADSEGDPVVVRFQVDWQADFASPHRQELGTTDLDGDGLGSVTVVHVLPENAVAWMRVRSEDDRGAASPWVTGSFFVNSLDEPPGPVAVIAPGNGEVVAGSAIEVRWAPALDVDRDELSYQVRITRAAADGEEVVWLQEDLAVPAASAGVAEGVVVLDIDLEAGAYEVQALATDDTGLDGLWGPSNSFAVLGTPGPGVDLDDFGTGCGCTAVSPSKPGAGLLALLLAVGLCRRRPRS